MTSGSGRVRLHLNENTAGCSPAVLAALRTLSAEEIGRYPEYRATRAAAAEWLNVKPASVLLTNGLDEGILAVALAGVRERPGARFVQVDPTFEMFEEFASMVGATLDRVPPEPDLSFSLDHLLARVTDDTRVIYLVDPNNPTGQPLPDGAAALVAASAPEALVLVDEAYADFSGRTHIGPLLERHPNLVVGRTFAKGHGLAGLRIGALVAAPATIARLRRFIPPFNVNIAAARALEAALTDDGYVRGYAAEAAESQRLLTSFCTARGLSVWPSAGNFVLARFGDRSGDVTRALASLGIDVRDKSAAPGCAGCIRFTTGLVADTTRLIAALEDLLAPRQD
jgi:histidinol-phosphate aminotransferase